jgi:hypothetical protein
MMTITAGRASNPEARALTGASAPDPGARDARFAARCSCVADVQQCRVFVTAALSFA